MSLQGKKFKIKVDIVRVFVDKQGKYGSSVGIVIDEGSNLSSQKRQDIARRLGFSETVFVNQKSPAEVSFYGPQGEVGFAGAPLLGAAWLLSKLQGNPVSSIKCNSKEVKVAKESGLTWIIVNNLDNTPLWHHKELGSYREVEALSAKDEPFKEHTYAWAWIDSDHGEVRAGRLRQIGVFLKKKLMDQAQCS